jgi:predicted MFS family arabinose efflux permease
MARVDGTVARSPARPATPGFGVLLVATAMLAASTSVVFPLLAQLQEAYDLPTWSLGVISGAAFLAGLLSQLLLAPLADRGHVRLLLLGGLALAVVSGVLFAASSSLVPFVLARLLAGTALGAFIPAARALASTVDPAAAGHNLGRLAAAELGGFVAGPVLGSLLFELAGLRVPFLVFAALAGLGLLLLARRSLPSGPAEGISSRFSLSLLRNPGVVVAALLALAIFLPVGIYDSLWARYMEDRGAGPIFVGVTLAMYGLPFVVLASTGGRLADRFGPLRSAFTCLVVIAPLTYLYGSLQSLGLIVALSMVEAAAQAVAVPASQAAMAEASPEGNVAAGQGLAGALQQLGAGVMALLAAPVYGATGPEVVFAGAGLLIVVIGVAAWLIHRRAVRTARGVSVTPDTMRAPDVAG